MLVTFMNDVNMMQHELEAPMKHEHSQFVCNTADQLIQNTIVLRVTMTSTQWYDMKQNRESQRLHALVHLITRNSILAGTCGKVCCDTAS